MQLSPKQHMCGLHDRLKAIEEEIDRLCLQKRLSIEAEYLKRIKSKKALRCYVKVSVRNGVFVRLDSRVINDYKNGGEMRFPDVVKRFCVVFDSNLTPTLDIHYRGGGDGDTTVDNRESGAEGDESNGGMDAEGFFEWTSGNGDPEAFEVKRDKVPRNIRLVLDFKNPREVFKLAPKLRNLLMKYTETKPNVLTHIWRYSNKNGLASTDPETVRCDAALRDVLGVDVFTFAELPELIVPHLCPLDYLVVDIPPVDGHTEIFDVPFEWDDLYQYPSMYSTRVYALDKKIESLGCLLKRCREKEKTLDEFRRDPLGFINRWICVESNDPCYKTPFFCHRDVQEGVFRLLERLE